MTLQNTSSIIIAFVYLDLM